MAGKRIGDHQVNSYKKLRTKFVPDRRAVFREARRVLKRDGILLFNVWDRIEENPHATVYAEVIEGLFPDDAEMRFRVPYEMHDPSLLQQLLSEAGFR